MRFLAVAGVVCLVLVIPVFGQGAAYEDVVVDVGNMGLTVTNAGFIGQYNNGIRPSGS
ncbi:MAG: hypothetical protein SH809_01535 [Rhodothermales bacterium]|nr:hypothetical protein [Rhodothermales bacterium]